MKTKYYRVKEQVIKIMILTIMVLIFINMVLGAMLIIVGKRAKTVTIVDTVYTEKIVNVVIEVVAPSGSAQYVLKLDDYADRVTQEDVEGIARAIWGEAGGIKSKTEQSAVAWIILNQVDSNANGMRNYHCVQDVLAKKTNIQGYWAKINAGIVPEQYISLAYDVLCRYYAEKDGWTNVGRTIPSDYIYFMGDGRNNYFTIDYHNCSMNYCYNNAWDWSLASPYEN